MLAFHNEIKLKNKYVARVKKHYKLDEIIQGTYWEEGKGCAVGCTIENDKVNGFSTTSDWHARYEEALGIPRQIAILEDRIFEGLSNNEAKEFPLNFIKAVNVGADLSNVMPKFFVWLLGDKEDGVINFAKGYKDSEKAIKGVLKLYQETVGGKVVTKARWIKAKTAAAAAAAAAAAYAAAAAAYAAAYAADADADADAYAYAYAYAAAAADAADAADAAAAAYRRTARQVHYSKMAAKLIELISECK